MPAVIVALAIVFGSINPNFWSATNLANVSRQMSILALLALGQTFAILSGGIDLSVGSLLALVSVVLRAADEELWSRRRHHRWDPGRRTRRAW
jgi:ribose transport system permease protein